MQSRFRVELSVISCPVFIDQVVSSGEVIDIFAAAGLKKPDLSILSDEFLAEVNSFRRRTSLSKCCAS